MSTPTYIKSEIEKNKIWHIAWIISECLSDNAPINWGRFIWVAKAIEERDKKNESDLRNNNEV